MRKINKFGYLLVFTIPISFLLSFYSGNIYMMYSLPFMMFIVMPIIDPLFGVDNQNYDSEKEKQLKDESFYKVVLYAWAIVQTLMMLWIVYLFASREISVEYIIPMVINTMIMNGGVGIVVAHELGHKNNKLDKYLAKLLLIQVFYGHYTVKHNRGHHVHVGTPLDTATSRLNQSYYSFWKQSVLKGFSSAIAIEDEYLKTKKLKKTLFNHEVYYSVFFSFLFLILTTILVFVFNEQMIVSFIAFFIAQTFLSFSLLESVDYIEHYGIIRNLKEDHSYEKTNATHSWNANFILSNYFLFQLQRHSDHHLYATKNYQILKQYNESPQLPNGYPAMVLLTLLPPIWFRIMNKRLTTWKKEHE